MVHGTLKVVGALGGGTMLHWWYNVALVVQWCTGWWYNVGLVVQCCTVTYTGTWVQCAVECWPNIDELSEKVSLVLIKALLVGLMMIWFTIYLPTFSTYPTMSKNQVGRSCANSVCRKVRVFYERKDPQHTLFCRET